tara:strand:+ start:671 stop:820 length:150 start_codon:yes stop_codon:yes gene_type:complete
MIMFNSSGGKFFLNFIKASNILSFAQARILAAVKQSGLLDFILVIKAQA